jgi:CheY-like chemotaxis protein
MSRLFSRFQQATKRTHIKYGGSGLGLFISRQLTESMGGQIGVVSVPGKGSTFAFYIKVRRASAPHNSDQVLRQVDSPNASRRRSETLDSLERITRQLSITTPAPPRPCVLLVEDNVINSRVLTKQLERSGCIVYVANHGQEALDFLPNTKYWHRPAKDSPLIEIECILMDVEMPVLDGLTCTSQIRELQRRGLLQHHIGIIAITANARIEQIQAAVKVGVDAVLPKPFRVIDVLSKMDEIRSKISGAVG